MGRKLSYNHKICSINFYKNSKYKSIKNTLSIFNISNGSLFNWIRQVNDGTLKNEIKNFTRQCKITSNIKCFIREYVIKKVDFNYILLLKKIKKKFNIQISKSTLYRVLKKIRITRKRIKPKIIIKNKRKYKKEVKTFKKKIKNIPLNQIISIDESSFDTELISHYGWGTKGIPIIREQYLKVKKRYTLICAVSNKKIVHSKLIEGSSKSDIFKQFLVELFTKIGNNMYILLDNARIHHSHIVKNYVNTTTHILLFNVAYSPEFNPIERVFSKLKFLVRKKDNTKVHKLVENIKKSLKKINKRDLTNFFIKSLKCE